MPPASAVKAENKQLAPLQNCIQARGSRGHQDTANKGSTHLSNCQLRAVEPLQHIWHFESASDQSHIMYSPHSGLHTAPEHPLFQIVK